MKEAREGNQGWFFPYFRQFFWQIAAAALLGTLAVACAGALLYTSGYLISRSALKPENVLMVYVPIVLVRAFGFSKAVIQYLERLVGHDAALRVLSRMRVRLYQAIEPQAQLLRTRFRTGDLLGVLADDIEQLQNVYLRFVLPAVSAVLLYGAGIVALGRMDGMFALLMALYCGFLLFVAPAVVLWSTIAKSRRFKQERQAAYRVLTDAVFGMSDWILSGRTQEFLQSFTRRQMTASQIENAIRRGEWRIQWMSQCAIGGAIVLLVIWAGGLAAANQIPVTLIAAIGLVAFPLMDAFARISDAVVRMPEYKESLGRLREIESGRPSIVEVQKEKVPDQAGGSLKLDHVHFRYPQASGWSVQDVSFEVAQGGKMALLGRSGAGKSTILNLIRGAIQPEAGQVTINGQPVQSEEASACLFSVLNQQPYLFDTTVANNFRLGRPNASDEEVRSVTAQVGLDQLIESLPDSYQTRMQETGLRFSGGERQRIALARILLQNKPIVLLDEPTVGLDPLTERDLMATIFRVLQGKTLIWVTHHLSGVEEMDEVIFIEQGLISMRGTHEQLYEDNPRYRNLYILDCPLASVLEK
ncbi:thiol reductant ABC exporter subunit CydC [Brevibacillus sp. MER 51]|uniref:thiol reductant ABC exporter subunit CydC n=1 Tax=Brevibacillus sp. MER 51 TaxID=2939560 RepID=UPI00203B9DCC|nr:thiol reductant ABC exporter subunit CydC [Brevibacillus sp. MER 51]MCM3144881.1 thiol reductant ABC exporter subunit CydC [Brevibacillus sp. MER 51]